MLPTMGLYQNIDCPYFENSCDRPYCHFRHRRKNTDSESTSASTEVPTYNPTPKSQLVKTHIPISYVPDLAQPSENSSFRFRFNENLPTYKPTPISVLGTTAKVNHVEDKDEDEVECNVNFEDLENEFEMIDELINDSNGKIEAVEEVVAEVSKPKSKEPKNKSRDKSKSKTDEKSKHSSKKSDSKHRSSKDDKRHSSSKSNSKSSSKDKHRSSHRDKRENDHKSKRRESSGSRKKKKEKGKSPEIEENGDDRGDDVGNGLLDLQDFYDSDLEEDPIEECYKIFTEYKPTEPEIFPEVIKSVEEQPVTVLKKRIAHDNVDKNKPKTFHNLKPAMPSAAQIMVNRFKAIRQMQSNAAAEQDDLNEIKKHVLKRLAEVPAQKAIPAKVRKVAKPPDPPSTSLKPPDPSPTSLIDDIIGGKMTNKLRRIAPVQNVNSIQRAKAKIDEMAKQKAINSILKTTAQSNKGEKRTAHVPDVSASDVPDLLESERSKLPVNVRSRYLSMIFDECVKLYMRVDEAQQRAANEEFKCYERCSALVTYRNSAMLAINRLRKELQEREMSGLGPILPGDITTAPKDSVSEIKGSKFYNNIKQLVLTDDELVLHGFPREGRKPGLGKVPCQKQRSKIGLDEFDRVCCRCSKLYRVDEEGFALYEEECVYHPLKKRTFRGESFYLCCKSGEGTGCVTAATHVSESEQNNPDGEIEGYQMTMPPELDNDPRSSEVFALDCEMCYTTKGLELTRVTIVNSECKTVYESLVKPLSPIIDYNTRFSGITKEQMNRTATSILQVQANILHLCNANTILIGHSLESDMKALKIIHSKIVDTSVLFPHKFGLPHKRALRDLAREYLKKIIQNDVQGHDSAEDALTCMELVQWKVKESFKSRGIKT